jgi:hypothetical protein
MANDPDDSFFTTTPEEQEWIDSLKPEEIEQAINTHIGYDAGMGVFRPESEHWRMLIKKGKLKERRLARVHDVKALKHHYIDPEVYVTDTLTENTLCWYPENTAMLLYLKEKISEDDQKTAPRGLESMKFKDPTRGETEKAIEFNGQLATVRAGELTFGFMDRGSIRMTDPTKYQAAEFDKVRRILWRLNQQFARTLPKHYEQQNRNIPSEFRLTGTAFSTISILKSCPSAVHIDMNGNKLGLVCMTTVRGTEYSGGELCLPEYGLKVPVKPGDILVAATAREWHCNLTPVKGTKYSIVCYYRWGLANEKRLRGWRDRNANGPGCPEPRT